MNHKQLNQQTQKLKPIGLKEAQMKAKVIEEAEQMLKEKHSRQQLSRMRPSDIKKRQEEINKIRKLEMQAELKEKAGKIKEEMDIKCSPSEVIEKEVDKKIVKPPHNNEGQKIKPPSLLEVRRDPRIEAECIERAEKTKKHIERIIRHHRKTPELKPQTRLLDVRRRPQAEAEQKDFLRRLKEYNHTHPDLRGSLPKKIRFPTPVRAKPQIVDFDQIDHEQFVWSPSPDVRGSPPKRARSPSPVETKSKIVDYDQIDHTKFVWSPSLQTYEDDKDSKKNQ